MARVLCHHSGRYNFYSTVVDGFLYESDENGYAKLEWLRKK